MSKQVGSSATNAIRKCLEAAAAAARAAEALGAYDNMLSVGTTTAQIRMLSALTEAALAAGQAAQARIDTIAAIGAPARGDAIEYTKAAARFAEDAARRAVAAKEAADAAVAEGPIDTPDQTPAGKRAHNAAVEAVEAAEQAIAAAAELLQAARIEAQDYQDRAR